MALRVRFQHAAGATLNYSVERLSDGQLYDFADGTFKVSPTTSVSALAAGSGNFIGKYSATIDPSPPAQFTDGDYCVGIHDGGSGNLVISLSQATVYDGDDATWSPAAGFTLAADALDAVEVEPGINARQALSPILAASAGKLSGAGTGSITIKGGGGTTTRVTATVDAHGNRTAVSLNLPS